MFTKNLPPIEILQRTFHIDPFTNVLVWTSSLSKPKAKRIIAGMTQKNGYVMVSLKGKKYPVHRIIWKLLKGKDPKGVIDHINNNPSDNRIENLRECSHSENLRNRGKNKNNTTGLKNISFCKSKNLWVGSISINRTLVFRKYSKDKKIVIAETIKAQKQFHNKFRHDK